MAKKTSIVKVEDLVYLKLPKCGSTSVIAVMGTPKPISGLTDFGSKKVFSVVRNPFSRLVSCWADRVNGNVLHFKNTFCRGEGKAMGIRRGMSFAEFVITICSMSDEDVDVHVASMDFLINYFIGRDLDFFLKLEHLSEDWQAADLPFRCPGIRKKSKHKPWIDYYKEYPSLEDLVFQRYERDFRKFDYPCPRRISESSRGPD